MMKRSTQIAGTLAILGAAGSLYVLFRPQPILVDIAEVHRGPLKVLSEEEGKTRMHDHFVLAASVSGKTRRIELHAGDRVHRGEIVAWIDPAPIDPRESAVLEARLHAAMAAKEQAGAALAKATNDLEQTQREFGRAQSLWEHGIISKEAYERAVASKNAATHQLEQSKAALQVASFQAEEAQSSLLIFRGDGSDLPTAIRTPVDGRVLRLIEQNERIVASGTPLIEIGYTPHLEIVSDYLTREAAGFAPGMPALITDWGGAEELKANVKVVEPGGFTKVSALGVEEQRVYVILDFEKPPVTLQDGFHVHVAVITWQSADALLIPVSAVFRSGLDWKAFVVHDGIAKLTTIVVGHRGEDAWEVMGGVSPGEKVIVHPASDVSDGSRIRSR